MPAVTLWGKGAPASRWQCKKNECARAAALESAPNTDARAGKWRPKVAANARRGKALRHKAGARVHGRE
eukprot:4563587-Alexandrium_andersonii.AAC.1